MFTVINEVRSAGPLSRQLSQSVIMTTSINSFASEHMFVIVFAIVRFSMF